MKVAMGLISLLVRLLLSLFKWSTHSLDRIMLLLNNCAVSAYDGRMPHMTT